MPDLELASQLGYALAGALMFGAVCLSTLRRALLCLKSPTPEGHGVCRITARCRIAKVFLQQQTLPDLELASQLGYGPRFGRRSDSLHSVCLSTLCQKKKEKSDHPDFAPLSHTQPSTIHCDHIHLYLSDRFAPT